MIKKPKIGAHVSVAGGLHFIFENARAIGAECAQIFGASPRQWRAKMPNSSEISKFKTVAKNSSVSPIFLHAAYLANLASSDKEILAKSIQSLTDHLTIAALIRAEGLIFHVGSSKGGNKKEALDEEVRAIKEILKKVPGQTKLIMENTAGGGEKVGSLEDISYIYKKVQSPRLKICFDTAHAFESGLINEYAPQKIKNLFDEWDKAIGLENLVALHVNDSKTKSGSNHDRHENIGEGEIGLAGFKNLAKEKRISGACWLLEVPGFDGNGPDRKNIDILKSCF